MNIQCSKCSGWYANLRGLKIHLLYCKKGQNYNETFIEEEYKTSLKDPTLHIGLKDQSIHPDDADIYPRTAAQSSDNDGDYSRDNFEDLFNNDVDSSFHRPLHRKTKALTKFEIMLNDLLLRHKASLLLYDEIVALVSTYLSSPDFNRYDKIKSRKTLLASTQKSLNTSGLQPIERTVQLHNNKSPVIVPVFDAEHMIKSLLSDTSLMKESNFAEGYNVITGEVLKDHPANNQHGEVHTGDAWIPARNRYCQD